jgi:hypothetical protein
MWELLLAAVLAGFTATGTVDTVEQPEPPPSLSDLPRGAPPRVGYVDHGVWHGTDGARIELPDRHGISAITAYRNGFFIADMRHFEGSVGLARVDRSGRVVADWASSGSAAVGSDGSIAWTSFVPLESGEAGRSLVHRVDPCGREIVHEWPHRAPFSVAGWIGDQVVVDGAFQLPVELLDSSGSRTLLPLAGASDASGTLVAGNLDPDGYTSGVVDAASGKVLWRVRASIEGFSPSGHRVVVSAHRGRDTWVARASDGRRLWDLDVPARSYTRDPVWEDERHVLAVTIRGTLAAILRFGRDGTVERATGVSRSDYDDQAYVLATQP